MILQHSETAINRGENPHQEANKEARNDQDFPKSSSYKTTNACSQRASVEQVLTIAIFVIITGLHGAFITSAAVEIQSEILWTLVGFTYAILGLIIYDYLFLSCSDPVDDMLLNSRNQGGKQEEVLFCRDCNSRVHSKSHHCKRCHRCVQEFDHHCKYLNNCIGGKNYHEFLRMLLSVTAYCLAIIGTGVWVVVAGNDPTLAILSRWGALATLCLAGVTMVAVDSLLCFHFYLVFHLKTTTLNYIMNRPDSEDEKNPA